MKENQMVRWLVLCLFFSTAFSSLDLGCKSKTKELIPSKSTQRKKFMDDNNMELFKINDSLLQEKLEFEIDWIISDLEMKLEDKVEEIEEWNEIFKFIVDYETKNSRKLRCFKHNYSLLAELYKKMDIIQNNQNKTTEEKESMIEKEKKKLLFFDDKFIDLVTLDKSSLQEYLDDQIDLVLDMNVDDEDPEFKPSMIKRNQKAFKFLDENKMNLFDFDDRELDLELVHEITQMVCDHDTTSETTEDKIKMIQEYMKEYLTKFIADKKIKVTKFNEPELQKKLDNEINSILSMNEIPQSKIFSIKLALERIEKEYKEAKDKARKKALAIKKAEEEAKANKQATIEAEAIEKNKEDLKIKEKAKKKQEMKEKATAKKEQEMKEKAKAKKEQEMKENARKDAETERKNKEDAAKKTTNSDSGCTITISLVAAAVVFVGLVSFFLWRKDFCSIKEYDTDEEEAAEKQVTPVTPPRDNLEVLESKTSEELVAYHPMVYPSVDQSMSEDTNSADGSYRSGTLDDHDRMIQLNDHVSTMRTTNHASRNSVLEVWPKESHDDYESKDYNEDE